MSARCRSSCKIGLWSMQFAVLLCVILQNAVNAEKFDNVFLNGQYVHSGASFSSHAPRNPFLDHAIISRQASPFTGPTYLPPKESLKCPKEQQCVRKESCQGGFYYTAGSALPKNQACSPETDVCCSYRAPPTTTTTTKRPSVPCGQDSDCVQPSDCQNGEIQALNYMKIKSVDRCYAPEVCCRLPSTTLTQDGYLVKVPEKVFPFPTNPSETVAPQTYRPQPTQPQPNTYRPQPAASQPQPTNEYLPPQTTQGRQAQPTAPQPTQARPSSPQPTQPRQVYSPQPTQPKPQYTPQPQQPQPRPTQYTPQTTQPRQPYSPQPTQPQPQPRPTQYTPQTTQSKPQYSPQPTQARPQQQYTPQQTQRPQQPNNGYLPPQQAQQPGRQTPAQPQPTAPVYSQRPQTTQSYYSPQPTQPVYSTQPQSQTKPTGYSPQPTQPVYRPQPQPSTTQQVYRPQPQQPKPRPQQPQRPQSVPSTQATQPRQPQRQPQATYRPQPQQPARGQPKKEYLPPITDNRIPEDIDRIPESSNVKPLRGEDQLSPAIFPPRPQSPNAIASQNFPLVKHFSKCASALVCTPENYCNSIGVITDTPVNLTPMEAAFRVPLTDCVIPETGAEGKCCRDSNYVDPWPVNLAGVCAARNKNTKPAGIKDIDANFAEIPWQAMILKDSSKTLLCGGAIIGDEFVLTTASCVAGQPASDIKVKAGEWELGGTNEPLPFQLVTAKSIDLHPSYDQASGANDMAIIRLQKRFEFASHIQPICISDQDPSPSEQCVTTGWGKQALEIHEEGAIMHVTTTSVASRGDCGADGSGVCGATKFDACEFDAGSALACGSGSSIRLKGVFSRENGCGEGQVVRFSKPDIKWINTAFADRNRPILKRRV